MGDCRGTGACRHRAPGCPLDVQAGRGLPFRSGQIWHPARVRRDRPRRAVSACVPRTSRSRTPPAMKTEVEDREKSKKRLIQVFKKAQRRNRNVRPEVLEREVAEAVRSIRKKSR